jgi:hypothetical protein
VSIARLIAAATSIWVYSHRTDRSLVNSASARAASDGAGRADGSMTCIVPRSNRVLMADLSVPRADRIARIDPHSAIWTPQSLERLPSVPP